MKEYELLTLSMDDLEEVITLYNSVKGKNGCVWDDNYPNRDILVEDIESGDLYGIKNENGLLIGAIAKDRDPEVDSLSCWTKNLRPGAEFARLVVRSEYQNQGIARDLHRLAWEKMKERGFASVHYMVAVENPAAIRSYAVLPYNKVGEVDMFGHHYLCYEKEL